MRFQPTLDVWQLTETERAAIQPGQWVRAGDNNSRGQYMGQRPSGADVVAWRNGGKGYAAKRKTLRLYAIAK
jgi:hypothetical protein